MICRYAVGEPARLVTPSWLMIVFRPCTLKPASLKVVAWPSISGPITA